MRYRTLTIVSAALLVLSLAAPAATAQQTPRIGADDVNDEPNFPDTTEDGVPGNGFTAQGPQGATNVDSLDATAANPPPLILEGVTEYDPAFGAVDVNSIINRAVHGDSYGEYDYFIFPGNTQFSSYFGWFADKGDQANDVVNEDGQEALASNVDGDRSEEDKYVVASYDESDDADGEIFDDWDAEQDPKDEFVWHGTNRWANLTNHESHSSDTMFAFIHPGTHDGLILDPTDNDHDNRNNPDLQYGDRTNQEGQVWVANNGFSVPFAEQSLFISTNVTTTANPPGSVSSGLNPTPDDTKFDGDNRYDIDLYQTVNPTVTDLYRTAVWDPGDEKDSPTHALNDEGPKEFVKDDLFRTVNHNIAYAQENVSEATEPVEDQQGFADDRAGFTPFPHEPNEDGDEYPFAPDNSNATYGGTGSDDAYYEPQPGAETYDTYEDEEHLWMDSQIKVAYNFYAVVLFGFPDEDNTFGYGHPGTDGTSTGTEEDDGRYTQPPGQYDVDINLGTWWDLNGDSFVGGEDPRGSAFREVGEEPYEGGTVDDPNVYSDNQESTPDAEEGLFEFRGTCGANVETLVYPHNNDMDGDGKDEWGTPVYRIHNEPDQKHDPVIEGFAGFPYPEMIGDATGGVGPIEDTHGEDQLTYFRNVGDDEPVPLRITCNTDAPGDWVSDDVIVSPTGTIDHGIKTVTTGTLTENRTVRDGAANEGNLKGETITDVDIAKAWELG